MICRTYRIHYGRWPKVADLWVFIFDVGPYREEIGLRTYHKRRRVWVYRYGDGKPHALTHRTRQVERALRLAGYRGEISNG